MDGSKTPTSTKSALSLLAGFYSPAQINSDDDLHKVSQQLSSAWTSSICSIYPLAH